MERAMQITDKQLVDLAAEERGSFTRVPYILYSLLCKRYAHSPSDTYLKQEPMEITCVRELPGFGYMGGRPLLVAYLHEVRYEPNWPPLLAHFKLLYEAPIFNHVGEESRPPKLIDIGAYEETPAQGMFIFKRKLKLALGDTLDGLDLLKHSVDYVPLVQETIDLAYRLGKQFETVRYRKKHALNA